MMSVQEIIRMSAEAAAKAAKRKKRPLIAFIDGDEDIYKMPNIGDYEPPGFEMQSTLFVDKLGIGGDEEPALTHKQFISRVKAGLGYAIVEEGMCQITVGVFKKKKWFLGRPG